MKKKNQKFFFNQQGNASEFADHSGIRQNLENKIMWHFQGTILLGRSKCIHLCLSFLVTLFLRMGSELELTT